VKMGLRELTGREQQHWANETIWNAGHKLESVRHFRNI
jgi:hypothetical protein